MPVRSGIPIAVCIAPDPPLNVSRTVQYPCYIREVIAHAGLCCDEVAPADLLEQLPSLRVLVTAGDLVLSGAQSDALRAWAAEGGCWLAIGGACGLPDLFGVVLEQPAYSSWGGGPCNLGEGYLVPDADLFGGPGAPPCPLPLHFFGGLAVRVAGGEARASVLTAHQRPSERAGVVDCRSGGGMCRLIAVDIMGAIVRIQQGTAITRDGVPAPDGTSPVGDGVLKSDDGAVLDWTFDRQPVPGVPGFSAFLHPIADLWRELLLDSLFDLAQAAGVALPLLWLYPDNLPAIGHMSHDTDNNGPEEAGLLLATLDEAGIRSTWCVIEPGYPADVMEAIRGRGHELAMHYDAMSDGRPWGEQEFERQWRALVAHFGGERPVANKNHYLRWEGDTEFYTWCERRGIQLDESKGASKTGEAGLNFGTCHPYFPVAPDGAPHDVLELATQTQDIHVFAPPELLDPLLAAALRHHGVLHLLFHPAHIRTAGVAEALTGIVSKSRDLGLEWWTSAQINQWERARRMAVWRDYEPTDAGVTVALDTPEPLPGATLLWLMPKAAPQRPGTVVRWGRRFMSMPLHDPTTAPPTGDAYCD
jgi:peptidoglycan/xylan/chitin deacetylase (PgdA/CDA1 family)